MIILHDLTMKDLRQLVIRLTQTGKSQVHTLNKEQLMTLLDSVSDKTLEKELKLVRQGKQTIKTVDQYLAHMTRDGVRALAKTLGISRISRPKPQLIAEIKQKNHSLASLKNLAKK